MGNHINTIKTDRALLDLQIYADYEAVTQVIDILRERYDFLYVTSIGESILSKNLHMVTIGNENADKTILYVGAHHGCEWITTLILLRFINELCEYYKGGKQPFGINLQNMLTTRCLRIVPMINPDGVDLQINGIDRNNILYDRIMKMSNGDFSKWQANARGVDLNHNYGAGFSEYKRIEKELGITAGKTRYSGEYPFSEPESGALSSLIKFDETIKMILTLHSAGEEIYYSSGEYAPAGADVIAKKLSKLSGYKLSSPEGLASYGGLTDWFIREFDRPSFTIECGKGETPLPVTSYYEIYASIREMLMWAPLLI